MQVENEGPRNNPSLCGRKDSRGALKAALLLVPRFHRGAVVVFSRAKGRALRPRGVIRQGSILKNDPGKERFKDP